MADPVTPAVTPGLSTSEGKIALVTTILGIAGSVVPSLWLMFSDLATRMPEVRWLAGAVSVLALLGTILGSLGYTKQRTALKVEALKAQAP